MSPTRSLLFASPIRPARTGNGLAMRAARFLEGLAKDHRVTLLVIPVAGNVPDSTGFAERQANRMLTLNLDSALDPLWSLCERVTDPGRRVQAFLDYPRPALCRYATAPFTQSIEAALTGTRFDAVHVMRAYLAPYLGPWLIEAKASGIHASLDLDDDEALTHDRFASQLGGLGRTDEARLESAEAEKYRRLEANWLPRFDQVITCTEAHAERVRGRCPNARVDVLANHMDMPLVLPRWAHFDRRILFVGNLSYLPNVLGLVDFVQANLPEIRGRLKAPVRLRIAGSAPSPEILALADQDGIELVSNPRRLARHYRWADLAIVPVHAGGGTRIKLLEAFAHGVPVVSTTLGAEGISVSNGVHLRLADSRTAFSEACLELLENPGFARRLARQARRLVRQAHSRSIGLARIRSAFGCPKDRA